MKGQDFDARMQAAMRETEAILKADPSRNIADPTLPIYRVNAGEELEAERARFERGDKAALLGAIRLCANHELPLPGWAADAYIAAYDKVLRLETGSWDEAFGRPYRKGVHLNAMRKKRLYRGVIQSAKSVAEAEAIGWKFGIGKTLAQEIYYGTRRTAKSPKKAKKK